MAVLAVAGLVIIAVAPFASAQDLLKPGQGLAGNSPTVGDEPATATPADDNVTQLPGVDVNGKVDPLTKSDKKLNKQKKALPGSEQERDRDRLDKLAAWYRSLPKTPDELNPDLQQSLQKTFDDGTTRENPGLPPVNQRRNPADYKDPIAVQEGR